MADTPRLHEIATREVHCEIEGMEAVTVLRDIPYTTVDGTVLTMDVYRPPTASDRALPVVILVTGYADEGMRRMLGCSAKDMASYQSWGRLIAASGAAAVTYTNRTPETAPGTLIGFLQTNADTLGIDASRLGLWSCSGHVPNALALLIDRQPTAACAVFAYGYMLDGPESAGVADAARRFGFVNPAAGRSVNDIPDDVPLLIVRAGLDEMPGLNESIDRFVSQATARNLPVSLINHARGAHAFDINEQTEGTGRVVRQILGFLRVHLNG